ALASGAVDHVLESAEMGGELKEMIQHFVNGKGRDQFDEFSDPYREILAVTSLKSRVDFTLYKQNTIKRRIQRRMDANRIETPKAYLELLKRDEDEINALFQDITINVTE